MDINTNMQATMPVPKSTEVTRVQQNKTAQKQIQDLSEPQKMPEFEDFSIEISTMTKELQKTPNMNRQSMRNLNYNSGRHISTNGQLFSDLLESIIPQLNIKDCVIIAHSMGGLVTRSAFYYAQQSSYTWPEKINKLIFLGTPHHGAPLERSGNWVNIILEQFSYAAPFARLAKIRSSCITDLRYGTIRDEDWINTNRFDNTKDNRQPVPLPKQTQNYAIAGALTDVPDSIKDKIIGDGLVPTKSALGQHANPEHCLKFPETSKWIGYGLNHWDLLYHPKVYEKIYQWCSAIV
jgi:hypothetical protein